MSKWKKQTDRQINTLVSKLGSLQEKVQRLTEEIAQAKEPLAAPSKPKPGAGQVWRWEKGGLYNPHTIHLISDPDTHGYVCYITMNASGQFDVCGVMQDTWIARYDFLGMREYAIMLKDDSAFAVAGEDLPWEQDWSVQEAAAEDNAVGGHSTEGEADGVS